MTNIKVKQLEWSRAEDHGVAYYKAEGFCIHRVRDIFNTGLIWVCHWPGFTKRRWFKDIEGAKAVAQADFERRVLACIETP